MFVFNKNVSKKLMSFGKNGIASCCNSKINYPYHKLIKLSDKLCVVCLDKNISIVEGVE